MDNPDAIGGDTSPEEAMRQLIQLRMQLGQSRFDTVARQMGMPDELLVHIEQTVALSGEPAASAPAASGLLDASGRPIGGGGGGLVDISGRPLSTPSQDSSSTNGAAANDDADDEIELDEDASRRMFQELVGVRMIIGPDNFTTLAEQMGMPSEAGAMVEVAAKQVEDEIGTRYEDQEEAMTVRLVNARMMMGQERFSDFAGQVGMPDDVVQEVETIAAQIEAAGDGDDLADDDDLDDDEDAEDAGPALA